MAGSIYVLMKPQITSGMGVADIHCVEVCQMGQGHNGINDWISNGSLGQKGVRGSIVQKAVLRTEHSIEAEGSVTTKNGKLPVIVVLKHGVSIGTKLLLLLIIGYSPTT